MKCWYCLEEFNPEILNEVIKHEHSDIDECSGLIKGVLAGKSYKDGNIEEIRYDESNGDFDVVFRKYGRRYRYFDVPKDTFDKAVNCEKIGKFMAENIKGVFRYAQIDYS
jgi:hypothetical protein